MTRVIRLIMRQGAVLAILGGMVGVVLGVIAFASYGRARRASTVDPMIALRAE
jgi:predicted membrane protein